MITQEYLKSILDYDKETGDFTWKVEKGIRNRLGSIAGTLSQGYMRIEINGKKYMAHRLVWLYTYGYFPKDSIDHMNNKREDNRLINLREATNQQNAFNRGKHSNNTSGFIGVCWNINANKYIAKCGYNGSKYYLGYFDDPAEASKVYQEFTKKLYAEFHHAS